jgi:hypothetical protein
MGPAGQRKTKGVRNMRWGKIAVLLFTGVVGLGLGFVAAQPWNNPTEVDALELDDARREEDAFNAEVRDDDDDDDTGTRRGSGGTSATDDGGPGTTSADGAQNGGTSATDNGGPGTTSADGAQNGGTSATDNGGPGTTSATGGGGFAPATYDTTFGGGSGTGGGSASGGGTT